MEVEGNCSKPIIFYGNLCSALESMVVETTIVAAKSIALSLMMVDFCDSFNFPLILYFNLDSTLILLHFFWM